MSLKNQTSLPYFDVLLQQFSQGNTAALQAFGHHVHWGYWPQPRNADGSVADFAAAAENLCRQVCDTTKVSHGDRVLDVGCGFGGTIASLNERFKDMQLVGLNIDPRQLARAREKVKPQNGNQIEFVEADACRLPFADASFDIVLAVECIFHFPSRVQFFKEVRRVLVPGGRLALSDFVPTDIVVPLLKFVDNFAKAPVKNTYGQVNSHFTVRDYCNLAKRTDFALSLTQDITLNTLPTYPVVRKLMRQAGETKTEKVTALAELMGRAGINRYVILKFDTI